MDSDLIRGLKYGEDMGYIRRLIKDGADVNAEDRYGTAALMIASGIEYQKPANLPAMKLLIENGANINAIYERYRHTPLIAASGFNNRANLQAIKLLIENGADVNAVNIYGVTPLMYAAGIQKHSMSNIEAFKLLLENGADMSTANIDGHTVFTVCTYPNNIDNLYLFQSAINTHYRRENLIFTAAASSHSTAATESATKIGKFVKISNGSRQDWKRHIFSFLSKDIKECA
jgi:ankyrin repeat protein